MQPVAAVAGRLLPGLDAPSERSTSTRNSRRALAWREQLERVAGHALEQARSREGREAVAQAHAEAVAHGPDWARIRRGSDYAKPVAVKDRNQLDRLLRWFARLERETYAADRAWAKHEQRSTRRTIPRTARAILLALVALARKYQTVHPSIERLASMGQMSRRTAAAVLDVLEALGLVVRHRRRKRERTDLGLVREVQDCSAYVLTVPEDVSLGAERPRPATMARTQSAKVAQQSGLNRQPIEEVRVAEGGNRLNERVLSPQKKDAGVGPTRHVDWRQSARISLAEAIERWSR